MADTPRVTVPVEPTLPLHPESARIAAVLRANAERLGNGVPSDLPGFHKDLWTAAEIIDMAEQGRAFEHQVNAMLSTAPAPEGGAVDWQPIETALQNGTKIDLWGHWPEHDRWARTPDAVWDEERCDWKVNGFYAGQYAHPPRFTHWRAISGPAALATREEAPAEAGEEEWQVDYNAVVAVSAHLQNQRLFDSAKAVERMLSRAAAYRNCRDAHAELAALRTQPPAHEDAPAEAGEIGAEYDAAAHCVTLAECTPGLFLWNGTLGFKSEYGAMEPLGSNPTRNEWKVGNRADAYCADSGEYFWGGTSNHDDRAKLLVYPISAEAVAMVASHGPSALRAQPPAREDAQPVEGRGHRHTAIMDAIHSELMRQFPGALTEEDGNATLAIHATKPFLTIDVSSLAEVALYYPAPDALRVAVEALEALAGEEGDCGEKVYVPCTWKPFREVARQALATLAALQAEQGEGE